MTSAPTGWPGVRAPGKVFLAGEYGVLAGGHALVMAVDRYAVLGDGRGEPASRWEREGLERLRVRLGRLPAGAPRVDDSALRSGAGEKLGLGSSAAWAACVTGSALLSAGRSLADDGARATAWQWGREVHGGGGSGADVAASVLGGVVEFVGSDAERPRARRVELASSRLPLVVRGPQPVSTRAAIAAVRAGEGPHLLEEAATVGDALIEALRADGDPCPAVRAASELLQRIATAAGLGAGAGTRTLERADRVARGFGGAAKPSGAGGGDLVLVYVPGIEPAARDAVRGGLEAAGLEVLDLRVDTDGLSSHPASAA